MYENARSEGSFIRNIWSSQRARTKSLLLLIAYFGHPHVLGWGNVSSESNVLKTLGCQSEVSRDYMEQFPLTVAILFLHVQLLTWHSLAEGIRKLTFSSRRGNMKQILCNDKWYFRVFFPQELIRAVRDVSACFSIHVSPFCTCKETRSSDKSQIIPTFCYLPFV
jgi:hypothetical protein